MRRRGQESTGGSRGWMDDDSEMGKDILFMIRPPKGVERQDEVGEIHIEF